MCKLDIFTCQGLITIPSAIDPLSKTLHKPLVKENLCCIVHAVSQKPPKNFPNYYQRNNLSKNFDFMQVPMYEYGP